MFGRLVIFILPLAMLKALVSNADVLLAALPKLSSNYLHS